MIGEICFDDAADGMWNSEYFDSDFDAVRYQCNKSKFIKIIGDKGESLINTDYIICIMPYENIEEIIKPSTPMPPLTNEDIFVGAKLKLREDLVEDERYGAYCFADSMGEFDSYIVKRIYEINGENEVAFIIEDDDSELGWLFTPEMFSDIIQDEPETMI
ncbi:MAG: hypothetical protein LBH89_02980 [Lactococcus lactis]|jgi:hypothetical protein|nr:hypothetical protein [Lactococcus lactis]